MPGLELVSRLGVGGFGEVWKAHRDDGKEIALKLISLASRQSDEELQALNILAQIRHPNLLHMIGHWVSDHYLMIATELADGTTADVADRYRDQGKPGIPRQDLLGIMRQAAEGIDYLNAPVHRFSGRTVSIQHRDVKPENIFVVGPHVSVGDFGIVKILEQLVPEDASGGTLLYAPPEMMDGQISRFSDQYSLALTYCMLLTGTLPFSGDNAMELFWARVNEKPKVGHLPEHDRPVLIKALSVSPEDRFPSCAAFVTALQEARGAVANAATDSLETKADDEEPPIAEASAPIELIETVDDDDAWTSALPLPPGFVVVPGTPVHSSGFATEIVCEQDGSKMVLVPDGEFDSGADGRRQTIHLSAFYIDKFPVTNAQFQWFCHESRYKLADRWTWGDDGTGVVNRSSHPVVWVTWDDALAFCQSIGKTLPTAAQWEKAARGTDGRSYPWGRESPDEDGVIRCNFKQTELTDSGRTSPVGVCPQGESPYGCHDMAGNVWEWCSDWHSVEPPAMSVRDPSGPVNGIHRVLMGGSWANGPDLVKCDVRSHLIPGGRGPTIGFRGVLKVG